VEDTEEKKISLKKHYIRYQFNHCSMALSQEARGMLDKTIDNMISAIPELVEYYRMPEVNKNCTIKNMRTLFMDTSVGQS
jgi:hypothetical protein